MRRASVTVLALGAAIACGAWSANYVVSNWLQIYGQESGSWKRLSSSWQPNTDPYSRAFEHLSGQLPLGNAEGQIFTATKDSDNQNLHANCEYQIIGEAPVARLFTLRTEGPNKQIDQGNVHLPKAIHSDQMIFRGTSFSISLASVAQPGNWLWLNQEGPFGLVLTIYDIAAISNDTGGALNLPRIVKGRCNNA